MISVLIARQPIGPSSCGHMVDWALATVEPSHSAWWPGFANGFLNQMANTFATTRSRKPWGSDRALSIMVNSLKPGAVSTSDKNLQFFILIWIAGKTLLVKWAPGLNVWIIFTPGDAKWWQKSGSTLVQLMVYRLFGNKPLPEPMMVYCEVDPTFIKKCIVG